MVLIKVIGLLVLCVMIFLWFLMCIFYWIGDRFNKIWGYKAGDICFALIAVIGATTLIAVLAGCIIYLSANI